MRRTFVTAIFVLVGLGGLAVLGSSPDFVSNLLESVQDNPITTIFSPPDRGAEAIAKERKSKSASREQESTPAEMPEYVLWQVVFDFTKKIETKAEELSQQGQDGNLFSKYFIRQGPLSIENNLILREIAAKYFETIDPLDQRAKKIIEEAKAKDSKRTPIEAQSPPAHPVELKELQTQKNEITMHYRDMVRTAFGEEAFNKFSLFLSTVFSEGATSKKFVTPANPEGGFLYYGFSWIIWDDTL